jgi:hypothetical protein
LTKQDTICAGLNVAKDECDSTGIERAVALSCGLDVKGAKESEVESQVEQKLRVATSIRRACFESTYPGAQRTFLAASVGSVQSWAVTGEVGHKVASFFREDGMKGKETDLPYAVSAPMAGSAARRSTLCADGTRLGTPTARQPPGANPLPVRTAPPV